MTSLHVPPRVSIAIPTYGREQVLVETVRQVLAQEPGPAEVMVLDQTPEHGAEVEDALRGWDETGAIRWLRLSKPSITGAMNVALREASCPIVLFLDDDIISGEGLIESHRRCYADPSVCAVAGQVLQPGQTVVDADYKGSGNGIWADLEFPFNSSKRQFVQNCMAGNLSVRRKRALAIGGFDESFVRTAYRFETEFCRRLWRRGGHAVFAPAASYYVGKCLFDRRDRRASPYLRRSVRPSGRFGCAAGWL